MGSDRENEQKDKEANGEDKDLSIRNIKARFDKFKKFRLPQEKSSLADAKTSKEKEEKTERSMRQRKKKKENQEESSRHKDDAVPEPDQVERSQRHRKFRKDGDNEGTSPGGAKSPGEPYTAREKKPRRKGSTDKDAKTNREKADTVRDKGCDGKTAREKGSGKTMREKRAKTDEGESKRERRKKKAAKKDEHEALVIHYEFEDTDAQKKAKEDAGPICSDAFGYGNGFPNWMLEVPRTIIHEVKPPAKLPMVKVFRTMIVYDVPQELREHIDVGDIICKFNDRDVTSREEYTKLLAETLKLSEAHTVRYTIYRTLRTRKIAPEKVDVEVPVGFEILADSFDYLIAYLTFVPKSQIGMNIKTYNGKVFVSAIDNGQAAIARKSLLVGDAILSIDDNIVSGIKMTEEALAAACSKRKYVKLLIERARTASGVRQVKLALCTEKTLEINPRMGEDIVDLCTEQLKKMNAQPPDSPLPIYRSKSSKSSKRDQHVNVADESVETPISTDVNNINLLATTPPVPVAKPFEQWDGRGGYVQGTPAQVRQIQQQLQQNNQRCRSK